MSDPVSSAHAVWEWMDWIWGVAVGVGATVAAMIGWYNKKLNDINGEIQSNKKYLEDDISQTADTLHARITTMEKLIVVLEGNHKSTMMLYNSLADGIKELNKKTDDQTKILHEVVGELKTIQRKKEF